MCVRCIFRIFLVHECLYSCAKLSPSLLYSNIENGSESEGELNINEDYVCRICLGILQFVYYDQQNVLVKSDSARDFALMIADAVKKEGHLVDSFSLEVSLPPLISENENLVWWVVFWVFLVFLILLSRIATLGVFNINKFIRTYHVYNYTNLEPVWYKILQAVKWNGGL